MSLFKYPILYTFRRCPFAIRARFVLRSTQKFVELREIKIQAKPPEFLKTSKKGTVPILILSENHILEESLDIIFWSLNNSRNFNSNFVDNIDKKIWSLIKYLDKTFKNNLDKYKYNTRFSDCDKILYRNKNIDFLSELNEILKKSSFIYSNKISFVDYIIFPFIRQFRNVNIKWFENLNLKFLNKWFSIISNSAEFNDIMKKYKTWDPNDKPIITNFNYN